MTLFSCTTPPLTTPLSPPPRSSPPPPARTLGCPRPSLRSLTLQRAGLQSDSAPQTLKSSSGSGAPSASSGSLPAGGGKVGWVGEKGQALPLLIPLHPHGGATSCSSSHTRRSPPPAAPGGKRSVTSCFHSHLQVFFFFGAAHISANTSAVRRKTQGGAKPGSRAAAHRWAALGTFFFLSLGSSRHKQSVGLEVLGAARGGGGICNNHLFSGAVFVTAGWQNRPTGSWRTDAAAVEPTRRSDTLKGKQITMATDPQVMLWFVADALVGTDG